MSVMLKDKLLTYVQEADSQLSANEIARNKYPAAQAIKSRRLYNPTLCTTYDSSDSEE